MRLVKKLKTEDILDYGCGKGTLALNLPFNIQQYDPAVKKYSILPKPSDIVVCTDVLEHIEPDLIDNVLTHIGSLTKKAAFLVANTSPANKHLPDGRNAHILLQSHDWWIRKMCDHFDVMSYLRGEISATFLVRPKQVINN